MEMCRRGMEWQYMALVVGVAVGLGLMVYDWTEEKKKTQKVSKAESFG